MVHEYTFQCPLPNGLHARPASLLSEVAGRFSANISVTNGRTTAVANAKSVLALVGIDVKMGDSCRVRIEGEDAETAHAALREFTRNVLPGCDEPLPVAEAGLGVVLPRTLREIDVPWHAGTVVCPGIGRGIVVVAGGLALPADLAHEPALSRGQEQERVRRAIASVRASMEADMAARPSAVEAGILRAHLAIVGDVGLGEKIAALVAAGRSAGQAIVKAAAFFAARMRAAESIYVRERAVDVEDIGLQLLEQIYGARIQAAGVVLTQPSVVAAENLTPRQLLSFDKRFLKALVLAHAGVTSHAVILARSFDIPTLTSVTEVRTILTAGQEAIVDANLGIVIPGVSPPVGRYYEREMRKLRRRQERFGRHARTPAVTLDGLRLEVGANVATTEELAPAFAQGADGIGLFRTEMLFMDRNAAPSEEEQFAIYVQAAKAAGGRPVIIRTFDVGGDKPVPYLHVRPEANPFLGCRGVRVYPGHRDVFAAQLRAILRASAFGRVWVMVPMVSALEEVRWVKARIAEARAELESAGLACDPAMPVGIMVEVPSAAFLIDQLAAEIDFFSIGTNDLAQYFLAVDRDSPDVAGLYSARHPAFLRLLAKIVEDARRHGRWVGMCGEMTRSPRDLPLLLGLGLDEISTAAPEIPSLKSAIAQSSAADCRVLLAKAMACRSVAEVEEVVAGFRGRGGTRSLLDPDLVAVGSDSASKSEAIQEIVDSFYAAGRTDQPQAIEEAVWARETVYSTGLGHGFAIPHCKTDAIAANSIGVVRLEQPVEWGSVDGEPVRCVILLAMRESDQDDAHMKVFSKLARKLMHEEFRERMLAAPDRAGLLTCLADELGLSTDQVG
jgi:phosphoenolpyruvate-protein phosphotransferase